MGCVACVFSEGENRKFAIGVFADLLFLDDAFGIRIKRRLLRPLRRDGTLPLEGNKNTCLVGPELLPVVVLVVSAQVIPSLSFAWHCPIWRVVQVDYRCRTSIDTIRTRAPQKLIIREKGGDCFLLPYTLYPFKWQCMSKIKTFQQHSASPQSALPFLATNFPTHDFFHI